MGRIKNLMQYPKDFLLTENDYFIGSDGDNQGQTRNYSIVSIAQFVLEYITSGGNTLSEIPVFSTAQEAFDTLGANKYFRWTSDNLDGVSSPNNTQMGITKN